MNRFMMLGIALLACACTKSPSADEDKDNATAKTAKSAAKSAGDIDFPVIPQIVVPEIIGIGPAQRALETSMQDIIDPVAGISVKPANCATDGALVNDVGITSMDAQGNLSRNGDEGIFHIDADGSGTANYEGGVIVVNTDGSGTINGNGDGGADDGIISVEADGSGTYNGKYGIIAGWQRRWHLERRPRGDSQPR